jgi:hypothetical protein
MLPIVTFKKGVTWWLSLHEAQAGTMQEVSRSHASSMQATQSTCKHDIEAGSTCDISVTSSKACNGTLTLLPLPAAALPAWLS